MKLLMKFILSLLFVTCIFDATYSISKPIQIKGHLSEVIANGQEVKLEYYSTYSQLGVWKPIKTIITKIAKNTLICTIGDALEVGYIKIELPGINLKYISAIPFLINSGDTFEFSQKGNSISFTGQNSAKFNCQLEIEKVLPKSTDIVKYDSASIAKYNNFSFINVADQQLKILNRYQNDLSTQFYEILKANINYKRDYQVYATLLFIKKNDSTTIVPVTQYYKQFIKTQANQQIDTFTALHSNAYLDCELQKLLCTISIASENKRNIQLSDIQNIISLHYKREMRDRMLYISLFSTFLLDNSMDFYIDKILKGASDTYTTDALHKYLKVFGKGAEFNTFPLTDTLGHKINLSDFKGKAIVLDFYFTGCHNCAVLNEAMTPIFDQYKSNPNIVFVSINLDKKFDMFKRAVKKGIYTHNGSIDLYTNGEGENHKIAQIYAPKSAPVLLLIGKNGKVFNGNPPLPFDKALFDSLKEYIDQSINFEND